jgi:hypothetical protein
MGCLNKQQIVEANDVKMEKVFVPELADGDPEAYVMVRTMTAKQRDDWDASNILPDPEKGEGKYKVKMENYRSRLCVICLSDDEGNPLFTLEEVGLLAGKSSIAIQRIYDAAQKINGIDVSAIEDAEKNS